MILENIVPLLNLFFVSWLFPSNYSRFFFFSTLAKPIGFSHHGFLGFFVIMAFGVFTEQTVSELSYFESL